MAVVDEAGVEVPTGTVGDVRVSGPGIMDGCWNESAMSRKTLRQGWVLTGDVGRYDEDGYLWFMGRRKDIIVYDGHKIAPLAVEAVLAEHPAVLQACVIGVPDADDGEVPHAYVIPEPGATADPGELAILHDAPRAATVRALTDAEVDRLAESIVRQVRRRGPFMSLSDFVNRRLVASTDNPGPEAVAVRATHPAERPDRRRPRRREPGLLPLFGLAGRGCGRVRRVARPAPRRQRGERFVRPDDLRRAVGDRRRRRGGRAEARPRGAHLP